MVWNQNFGCLGTGLPYAVGTSIADGGKPTVIHVPIDPVVNHGGNENLDTPNYARFRTWYAQGQQ